MFKKVCRHQTNFVHAHDMFFPFFFLSDSGILFLCFYRAMDSISAIKERRM